MGSCVCVLADILMQVVVVVVMEDLVVVEFVLGELIARRHTSDCLC